MISTDGKMMGMVYIQYRYENGDDFINAYKMPKNKFIFKIPVERKWLDEADLISVVDEVENG